MPQIKSAKKRVLVSARQAEENRLHRTRARTAVKKVRDLLAAGKTEEAAAHLSTVQKYLDKATKKNVFHHNASARIKSRLSAQLKKAGIKGATAKAQTPAAKPAAKKAAPKKAAAKPAAKKPAKPAPSPSEGK